MANSFPSIRAVSGADANINKFAQVGPVAGLANQDIVSFTVPAGKKFKLFMIEFSGENKGEFTVSVDLSIKARKRTYYSVFFGEFYFSGLELNEGQVIKLTVQNNTNETAFFEGRILGQEI